MKFWMQRVAMAILLLLSVSALTFGAMNVLGDPLFNILGPLAGDVNNPKSAALIEEVKVKYDLDKPLPVRYVKWLGDFAFGDMGVQFSTDGQPPVEGLIKERIPRTITLLVMAQLLAVMISIPWAAITAARAGKRSDKISTRKCILEESRGQSLAWLKERNCSSLKSCLSAYQRVLQ